MRDRSGWVGTDGIAYELEEDHVRGVGVSVEIRLGLTRGCTDCLFWAQLRATQSWPWIKTSMRKPKPICSQRSTLLCPVACDNNAGRPFDGQWQAPELDAMARPILGVGVKSMRGARTMSSLPFRS